MSKRVALMAPLISVVVLAQSSVAFAAQQIEEQAAAASSAQDTFDSQDIVVTAQKRNESAQDVPISLTALSSDDLTTASVNNVQDLQRLVPGFSTFRATQPANTRISIRGIGSAGNAAIEPSVGAFVDGIYIARPGPLLAAINDVASVEVLRGPQGTLFGRNASVGALVFNTNAPKNTFEGSMQADYASFNRVVLNGIINVPLSDGVATRFSALFNDNDGYGRSILDNGARFGGTQTLSLRGAIKAELAPSLMWTLRGDYQRQRGNAQSVASVVADTVAPTAAANFTTRLNGLVPILDDTYSNRLRMIADGDLRDRQWGLASDLSLDVGDFTLRLLSGYRDWRSLQTEGDTTLTPADIFGRDSLFRSKSHSQELQLISPENFMNGFARFVAGVYYFREDYNIDVDINLGSGYCNIYIRNVRPAGLAGCLNGPQRGAANTLFDQDTESVAAYGQATINITDTWDVTGGLRYSHDSKDGSLRATIINPGTAGLVANDRANLAFDGGKLTYRLNTTYHPSRDVMLFATLSTGYKSGGFDSGTGNTLGNARVFAPETTTNYEIGVKSQVFDRRLTLNATLFRMDVNDFQLRSYNGTSFSVRNAGSIRQQGAEFEVVARPTRELTLSVAGARLASEYTDFRNAPGLPAFGGTQDLTGERPSYSPKWQGNAVVEYRTDVASDWQLNLVGRANFTSATDLGGAGDNNPQGIEPGYTLFGGRIALISPSERWEFALSGENLSDRGYCTLRFSQTFAGPLGLNNPETGGTVQRCVLGEPRSLRASVKMNF